MATPHPKPTALKILNGNPGRRPLNEKEPRPDIGVPMCPPWLDVSAKTEWSRLAPQLAAQGLISENDLADFAAYCQAWANFQCAVKDVRKHGKFFTTGKGYVLPHPAVAQQNKAIEQLAKLGSLFGLNPSSRTVIKVDTPAPEDEFEKLLNGTR